MRPRHTPTHAVTRTEFLVAMLVILILVALLTPVLRETYESSLTLRCRQNLAEIFTAVQHYALNFDGFPPCKELRMGDSYSNKWRELLDVYLRPLDEPSDTGPSKAWACPAGGPYVGNRHVFGRPYRKLGELRLISEVGTVADGDRVFDTEGAVDSRAIDWRHHGGANVVFLDRHIEWIPCPKSARVCKYWDHPQ